MVDTTPQAHSPEPHSHKSESPSTHSLSRRDFMRIAAGAGGAVIGGKLFWADGYAFAASGTNGGASTLGTGTVPEQIHLQYGADPTTEMTVSWATPSSPSTLPANTSMGVTVSPSVGGQSSFTAEAVTYTDELSGEAVYAYHAPLTGLTPDTTYTYTITDPGTGTYFSSSFTTAPAAGRFPFAFTSYGDLAEPGAGATYTWGTTQTGSTPGETAYANTYGESQFNAYWAVQQVETMAANNAAAGGPPLLFHLLNGDLAYADKTTINSSGVATPNTTGVQPAPEVWRDYMLNVQSSAAKRPWMSCIGNHEAELDNDANYGSTPNHGYLSYNSRFRFPTNGASGFTNNFYYFQVGSVLFISLDANDVCYQGSGAYNIGLTAGTDAAGNSISAAAHQYNRQYTGVFGTPNADGTLPPGANAQTIWLQDVLASARPSLVPSDPTSTITPIGAIEATTIDWIVVQMHQCALSSSNDNGSDAGIRQAWVPLFDQYQVDVVVNGHDHDYERSYPVRGFNPTVGYSVFNAGSASSTWNKGWNNSGTTPNTSFYGTGGVQTYSGPAAGTTVNTFTPVVAELTETVPTADGMAYDSTKGTVYLVLGGGGTNKPDNDYGGYSSSGALQANTANVTTFTQIRVGVPVGSAKAGTKPLPDAAEPVAWSATQGIGDKSSATNTTSDGNDAYGIAYFSVDPGTEGGNTTITITYYQTSLVTAATNPQGGTAPTYAQKEQFLITRPRNDAPPAATPQFPLPAVAAAGTAAIAGGALYLSQRHTVSAD